MYFITTPAATNMSLLTELIKCCKPEDNKKLQQAAHRRDICSVSEKKIAQAL
jgi:hypothetical protein